MPIVNTSFIQKGLAIAKIIQATGYGRYAIERKITELMGAGKIRVVDDPGDRRRQLIRKEDVEIIIEALTPR